MQRTKSKILSILLSLVMLLSLLPTTALAATYNDVKVNGVSLGDGKYLASNSATTASSSSTKPTTYVAWYKDGTLTLNGYKGTGIVLQGAPAADLIIKLIGDNTITTTTHEVGIQGNNAAGSITITADNGSNGTLTINMTNSENSVFGINGYENSVTIKGSADVTINATTTAASKESYGIQSRKAVFISENASVSITCKASNLSDRSDFCNGIFSETGVTINTDGTIQIDVSEAGGDDAYSYGIRSMNTLTLTKVGEMTVKWKKSSVGGVPLSPSDASFNPAEYDTNVDETTCTATYKPKVATANISLNKTGTVDFGSMEESYTAAPAAETVTITNSGTAATGALTIALDGAGKNAFEVSPTSITNVEKDGGTANFTVQPKTGLSAGTYNATVKVSGTGVTEQSFDVKFIVTAPLTAIAVPTANSVTYDGTEKTGVSGGTGYTLGGTYKATDVGATDYTATATLDAGYKWNDESIGDKTINWNIGKRTPTAADFTFTAPTDLTYDGSNKTASVALKSPLTKSGTITPTYMKGSSVVTETKDVGTYTVKIDVAGGDNFNAVSNLTASAWTFSITPADQSAPTGLGVAAPTASSGKGKITGTTTAMEYSTDSGFTSPTDCSATETEVAPDTYYVRLKADANHNAGAAATVTVPAYSATKYTVSVTSDANGTAIADKTADVAAGETVTLTATPKTGYVFDKWDNKTPSDLSIGTDGKFTMPGENVSVKATFKGAALTGTASITGTEKFGQTLTATLTGGNNTGTLTYKWYRGSDEIIGATGSTYTLVEDDIGKTITVKITSSVQTGEINGSTTGTIEKADGPAAPASFTLTFTPNADGTTFTATIPTVAGGEYSFDGTNYSATNTKADCAANTGCTGYVRIAETPTQKASAATSDTQTSPKLTVATPTFTPNGVSSFTGMQSVTISCTTADAKIYYTTNGTNPTTASTEYTTALSLTSTTTVKAIAVKTDMDDSAIATATFIKYSGGGGGGGGSYTPSYTVSVDKTENGTITVSPKSASKGDTVTITVKPDNGYELDTLKVLDKNGDKVKLTEKNGKYTFTMPTGKVTVKGSFVEEVLFDDVKVGDYFYDAVRWAVKGGITNGVGNDLFAPNQPCTRAQIVTFLWRAAGSPAPKHMSSFADVPADAFYAKAVAWAVENGITGGTGDGKFSPDATCTRAQSVTFLYRAAGSPKVSSSAEFGDVATNAYYADAVAWAAKNGITGGIGGGQFGSGNDCTRAQIVTFLYRNYQSK